MAADLISLRLPFNGGPGPGGGQIVDHRTGKSRGGGLSRGAPHWRCGGVEAWRLGAGPNAEQNAYRWLAEGVCERVEGGWSGFSGMAAWSAAVPANPCQAWQAMTSFFWWTVELRQHGGMQI